MTDAPKLLSREEPREVLADFLLQGHLTYRAPGLHGASDYQCADAMIRDLAAAGVTVASSAHIAALEAERDDLQARNAQIDADNKAADFAYRQQQIADYYDGYGEPDGEDVPSNALYRGNSVSWIHSKAYNYGKSLARVWDSLNAAGIKSDGKTHCADAVLRLAAERDAAYARGLEDAAKVADAEERECAELRDERPYDSYRWSFWERARKSASCIAAAIRAQSRATMN